MFQADSINPRTINVELPAELLQVAEQIAARRGITMSELGRQILEYGQHHLPFRDPDKSQSRYLTFWVDGEYGKRLRELADNQDTYLKTMILYWFISCLKDEAYNLGLIKKEAG